MPNSSAVQSQDIQSFLDAGDHHEAYRYIADQIEPALKDGEVELWLVDFIVPQATAENKLAQTCLADLMKGPLNGKTLKMHKVDPKTGEKTTMEVGRLTIKDAKVPATKQAKTSFGAPRSFRRARVFGYGKQSLKTV